MPNRPTCLTCRFWTPFPSASDLTEGTCEGHRASFHAAPGTSTAFYLQEDGDLVTGCDFGCALHESA